MYTAWVNGEAVSKKVMVLRREEIRKEKGLRLSGHLF